MTNVRELSCASAPAALRAVLLDRPDAHPVWKTYLVSLVHLRPLGDGRPCYLAQPDSSHEIMIRALDPRCKPDPAVPSTIRSLDPPNLIHQLRGQTDETALTAFGAFVQALSVGELNPDSDFTSYQIAWLDRWSNTLGAFGRTS
jgi:hypothetical protein